MCAGGSSEGSTKLGHGTKLGRTLCYSASMNPTLPSPLSWQASVVMMIVYPRETPPHTRTARTQPPAAHRRWHSRLHHHRHGEHSPTARQPHSNGLCSPPKEGPVRTDSPCYTCSHSAVSFFARHGFNGDLILCARYRTVSQPWERSVLMAAQLPPPVFADPGASDGDKGVLQAEVR